MITMKRIFSIAVVLLATIVFCQGLMAQRGEIKSGSQDKVIYTFEKVYYKHPPVLVPGLGIPADSTGIHPLYFPSGDQAYLLVKGPVVRGISKNTKDGYEIASFSLDDNGWFDFSKGNMFVGEKVIRDPKKGNRIVESIGIEEDFDGGHSSSSYRYDEEGWRIEEKFDSPCGCGERYINHNTYHDPLSERLKSMLYSDEKESISKTVYTVTKTDCFHNWLERDVQNYNNGRLSEKWHESRTLHYLNVIDRDRGAYVTRPFSGKHDIGLISSDKGGRMFFYHGTKWKYCRIWGKNEKHTHMKSGMQLKSVFEKPAYPGGQVELDNYLQENLQYPEVALNKKVQGTVKVNFTVSETGEICDVEIAEGVSQELDDEAVRLVENMKTWTPAKRNGEIVVSHHTLPLIFSINPNAKPKHDHKWENQFESDFDYQTITWTDAFEPKCGEHKHMLTEIVEGGVEERSFNVNVTNLPLEFTFKADNDRLVFVRKKEIGNKYISKTPVSRGLWATLCFEDVAQYMFEPGDRSPAPTESFDRAQRLVAEMNKRSEARKERWEYMMATKQELKALGISYEEQQEDVEEAFDSERGVYVVAVPKTSANASSTNPTYLLKYNITYECRRCGYKSLTYSRRMRFSNKDKAELRWMRIKSDVSYRNRNDQMEVDDPTLYREKDMKLYLVHYLTWRECNICHAREPLTKNTFAFTDYSTASSFLADARMGKSVEELKKLAKGEAVEEQPESTEENDNSFATKKKKLHKGEIEGHEHEYKVTTSARRRTEKQGNKIFYLVDVTTKKTCWLCKHSEKISTKTERFSTSREASEFYKSQLNNE